MRRPLILVSNDDGVLAPGNVALREALERIGDVYTVAPTTEQSANSHSLTLHRPLRFERLAERVWAVDGTPADCVYVALVMQGVLPRRPDLVASGINHGPNLGADVHYSGTVAAAREAALRGIAAIAFSLVEPGPLEPVAALAATLCERMLQAGLPGGPVPLLNVNVPPRWQGIRATRLGLRRYEDAVTVRTDPRGRGYLWLGGAEATHEPVDGSDTEAVDAGWVSVTPLAIEVTYGPHMPLARHVAGVEAAP
ncbi:MAG: 5'/3'-nucleotidase SurE [Myxococcales bacterium]|nr:5'/3'-nucleotidase SurE [Myxococcales bacterium]